MKKSNSFMFLVILGFFSFYLVSQDIKSGDQESKKLKAVFSVESQVLFDYVEELCQEKFGGRLTGTKAYDESAEWLIKKFKKFNVKPLLKNNSYLQKFSHPYTLVKKNCSLELHIKAGKDELKKKYHYFDDFIPGSTSGSGKVCAEVVYVGYGVTAPELGYDDYRGINVKGKIVVMEKEVPVDPSLKNKKLFKKWRKYSFHQYKLQNAYKHGAAGMLYNYGPIANPNNAYIKGFVYTHIGDSVMKDLFAGTGKKPEAVKKKIKMQLIPSSFNTKKTVTIINKTEFHPEGIGSNVIGYIEGNDPVLKTEFILIGGHLDHLGYCYDMMPGANDNASAVAVMLGVAEAFYHSQVRPQRSIMFIAFGAEEAAIRGTQFYLKNPPIPKAKMVCLINMDGVGIGNSIFAGFGKNYPGLFGFFAKANKKYIHRNMRAGFSSNLGRPRLDAAFFDWAGIPVLSFSTWGGGPKFSIYHTPNDKIDFITPEIMEDMAKMLYLGILNMSNQEVLTF